MPRTPRQRTDARRTIDSLLADAATLVGSHQHHDTTVAPEPLAPAGGVPRYRQGGGTGVDGAAAPAPGPTAHERAGHELGLVCALVLGAGEAASSLDRLANDRRQIEPEGALVFACLLHVSCYGPAAEFWWRFAAGGGSRTAAYCLYLSHRRHGEFRDAEFWREQARHGPERRPASPGVLGGRRLLPDEVCRALLAQWHSGLPPQLPPALETVIHRLSVDGADADYGEIPQPSPDLLERLASRN